MKRFLILLSLLFCNTVCAETININWIVDGQQYGNPTTCEYSGDIILPTAPTKYGYTFAGWEPGDYIFLEYIEGLDNIQYIDTGVIPTKDMKIYAKFAIKEETNKTISFFGCRSNWYKGVYIFVTPSFFGVDWFGQTENDRLMINNLKNIGDLYEFNINNSLANVTKNGVHIGSKQFNKNDSSDLTIFINGINSLSPADSGTKNRIYHFKIDGIADMRPAVRLSDNAVGMYDVIRQSFFENAGTGAFTAGPVINE
jgi:hypothetical protein